MKKYPPLQDLDATMSSCTQIGSYAHQHMNMIRTGLHFMYLHVLPKNITYILLS